jgi:hypothetical protein
VSASGWLREGSIIFSQPHTHTRVPISPNLLPFLFLFSFFSPLTHTPLPFLSFFFSFLPSPDRMFPLSFISVFSFSSPSSNHTLSPPLFQHLNPFPFIFPSSGTRERHCERDMMLRLRVTEREKHWDRERCRNMDFGHGSLCKVNP